MKFLFDENGFFNLDEAVMATPSFKKIMEDGVVTDSELAEQAHQVSSLLHKLEDICSEEQTKLVKELLTEMSVLFSIYHYHELQTLN